MVLQGYQQDGGRYAGTCSGDAQSYRCFRLNLGKSCPIHHNPLPEAPRACLPLALHLLYSEGIDV